MNMIKNGFFIVGLIFSLTQVLFAQYTISYMTIGIGSGEMGNNSFRLKGTLGQTIAGNLSNASYRVSMGFWSSAFTYTTVKNLSEGLPIQFELYQNYPNPFNPVTYIKFALPQAADVRIELFNSLGQLKEIIIDKKMPRGYHVSKLNGSHLASGMYFYRISAKGYVQSRKLLLIK